MVFTANACEPSPRYQKAFFIKASRFRIALTSSLVAAAVAATTVAVPQASAEPQLATQGAENVNRCTFEFAPEDKAAFQEIDKAIVQAYLDAVKEIRAKHPELADAFAKADADVRANKASIRDLDGMKRKISNYKDLENKLWNSPQKYRYGSIELIVMLPELADDLSALKSVLWFQPTNITFPTNNIKPADLVPAANLRKAGEGQTYDVEKQYRPIEQANKQFFNIREIAIYNDSARMRGWAQDHWGPVVTAVANARSHYNNEDLRRLGQACEAHLQNVKDENTPLKRLGLDKIISDAVDKFIAGAIGENDLNAIIMNALKEALGGKTADQAIADTVIKSMGGKTLDQVLNETVDQFLKGTMGEDKLKDVLVGVTKEALGNRPLDEVLANTVVKSMGGKTLDVVINETIDQFMKGLIGEQKLNDIIQGAIREALGEQGIDDAISNTIIKSMGGKTLDKVLAETVDQFLGDDKLNDIILNIMREALGNRPVDDVVAGMILKSMGGNTLDKVAQDIIDKSLDKLTGGKTLGKIGEDLIDYTSSKPSVQMLSVFAGLFGALGLIAAILHMIPLAKNAM